MSTQFPPYDATALIGEATKKSGLLWVRPMGDRGADRPWPVWHLWHEGSAYVLIGGLEQEVPGLAEAAGAAVTVRSKDNGGRLVVWTADVSVVAPGTPTWVALTPLLQAKRLNSPDGEEAPRRWARECTLLRLTPTGELLERPDFPATGSQAHPPPATPATTRVRVPLTLHRRPRRRTR